MKGMTHLLMRAMVLTLFSAALWPWLADRPMDIRIELQIVAIPEDLELPLVADFLRKDRVEAAHGKIQELLAQKRAKLIGWSMVTTRSGQRAVVEAVNEIYFPQEFDPRRSVSPRAPIQRKPQTLSPKHHAPNWPEYRRCLRVAMWA